MQTKIPTIQFTERTDLHRLHFAMIATRQERDADTIIVIYRSTAQESSPSLSETPERFAA